MRTIQTGKKSKKGGVRHTRAIQHDRSQHGTGVPNEEAIKNQLLDIVHPATLAQIDLFRSLGLRERTLSLPVTVALVVSLIWRQLGSVSELARVVNNEAVMWAPKMKVSMQALNERMRVMPAFLFLRVLMEVLPVFQQRWAERKRPLSAAQEWVRTRYDSVLICDGSTLDALLRKTGLLLEEPKNPLAGRMIGLIDMLSRLPKWIGYTDEESANDQRFFDDILEHVSKGALLVFDLGYTNYDQFARMTDAGIKFITRAKRNMSFKPVRDIVRSAVLHDQIVLMGNPLRHEPRQMRLTRLLYQGKWYEYLSNELDPEKLPAEILVNIYRQRWRIEDAFLTTKSLLGLSYFFSGADNAVSLQVWATWLLYAVLVDMTDMVAEALAMPFADISMEMVYRALPYYVRAKHRGETTDLLAFLIADHKLFGLVKRKRPKTPSKHRLTQPWNALDNDNLLLT